MNEKYPLALSEGTVLAGQYIIEKVLGQGGFGITYEAKDHKTEMKVAVKEFFPDAMATRTDHTMVMPFSGERGESYEYGKNCFLQEAETLAKFIGNENIVRIHSYFEENGTAYFVMDYIEGTSFDDYIKQQGGKVSYEECVKFLVPIMDALSVVHSKGIVHRDVTPDNIYITKEGIVKLLDFGAARYSLGDKSRSLDIILKHGFAPKEQYTRRGKQGPYTDVYSLGATFYFALTGKRPPDSVERMDEDELVPPSTLGAQIDKTAEDAIFRALSVQPAERFQSMGEFKNAMLNIDQGAQQTGVLSEPVTQEIFVNEEDWKENLHIAMKAGGAVAATGMKAGSAAVVSAMKVGSTATVTGMKALKNIALNLRKKQKQSVASPSASNMQEIPVTAIPAKNPVGKKKLYIAIAAIVVICIAAFGMGKGKKASLPASESITDMAEEEKLTADTTEETQPDMTEEEETRPDTTEEVQPDMAGEEETQSNIAEEAQKTGNVSIVGNYAENIMNGGGGDRYGETMVFATESWHSLEMEKNGKLQYIFKSREGQFSDVSLTSEIDLYFLYDGMAFYGDLSGETSDAQRLAVLEDYAGKIQRLLITEDYYVICCGNTSDNTYTVYRVHRINGESRECCTIENKNQFTLSDDGWLYYVERGNDNSPYMYRMRLDTFEKDKEYLFTENAFCGYMNPIVVDDYIYFCKFDTSDEYGYSICKINKNLIIDEGGYSEYQIGSRLGIPFNYQNFGFNVTRNNHDIFFYIGDGHEKYELYHVIKGSGSDVECEYCADAFAPYTVYYTDGSYALDSYEWDDERGNYIDKYSLFDADGNLLQK